MGNEKEVLITDPQGYRKNIAPQILRNHPALFKPEGEAAKLEKLILSKSHDGRRSPKPLFRVQPEVYLLKFCSSKL